MINVSYCGLEEQTITLLLRSVRANCALQVLKMQGNNLSGKGTFILSKRHQLVSVHCLVHYLLCSNSNPSLCAVAAMKFNENLQELWLGSNHLGPEDGQHLGSILRTNHTLRVLDLRENNLQVKIEPICTQLWMSCVMAFPSPSPLLPPSPLGCWCAIHLCWCG